MPQFTPETLRRLLLNVEREVLTDAVDGSEIDLLFTSQYRETLDELLGIFNFFANLNTFGLPLLRLIQDELPEEIKEGQQALKGLLLFLGTIADVLIKVVQVFLPDISLHVSSIPEILSKLDQLLDLPADSEPTPHSHAALISSIRNIESSRESLLVRTQADPGVPGYVDDALFELGFAVASALARASE